MPYGTNNCTYCACVAKVAFLSIFFNIIYTTYRKSKYMHLRLRKLHDFFSLTHIRTPYILDHLMRDAESHLLVHGMWEVLMLPNSCSWFLGILFRNYCPKPKSGTRRSLNWKKPMISQISAVLAQGWRGGGGALKVEGTNVFSCISSHFVPRPPPLFLTTVHYYPKRGREIGVRVGCTTWNTYAFYM